MPTINTYVPDAELIETITRMATQHRVTISRSATDGWSGSFIQAGSTLLKGIIEDGGGPLEDVFILRECRREGHSSFGETVTVTAVTDGHSIEYRAQDGTEHSVHLEDLLVVALPPA